jgi:prenylcysteine oxidase/farnesylcysteine lyase
MRAVLTLLTLRAAAPLAPREERVVGIVGSGVAGASTAHFLRESRPDLRVIVYERDAVIGGRAKTVDLGGRRIDLGATAISTLNQYLLNFTHGMKRANDGGPATLGIFDGAGFRFQSSEGTLPLAVHLTEHYGVDWLKIIPVVRQMASRLNHIYELQRRGVAFETPVALLEALDLYNLTQVSAYDYFRRIGLPSKFIYEFIDGASRDNYNQDGSLNALADLVSLAGAGLAGDVFELQEGTAQIPQLLLKNTEVRLNTRVAAVRLNPSQLNYAILDAAGRETIVDAVVVATPLEFTNLSLPLDVGYRPRPYQATYVALAAGRLSRKVFGARADDLDQILTVETTNVSFSCIGAHGASAGGDPIYKVMSRQRLSDAELDYVFERRSSQVVRADWNASGAYTRLDPTPGATWPPFVLRNRLFYANMESPVSCMETQIISGKNAALLVAEALPL